MKITFFGTSAATPRKNRRNTSIFFEIGEHKYIFDMGCNVIEDLSNRGIDCEEIDAVFISHMHGDHTGGLIPFLGNIDRPALFHIDPLICLPPPMEQTIDAYVAWRKCTSHREQRTFRFQEIEVGTFYDDGTLKVTAYRTEHCWMSFALKGEAKCQHHHCTDTANIITIGCPSGILRLPFKGAKGQQPCASHTGQHRDGPWHRS